MTSKRAASNVDQRRRAFCVILMQIIGRVVFRLADWLVAIEHRLYMSQAG